MNHETSKGLILDYLYGELDEASEAEFKQHTAACAECAEELKAIRKTLTLYRSAPVTAPPQAAEKALAGARAAARQLNTEDNGNGVLQPATPETFSRTRFLFHPIWGIAAVFLVVCGILLLLPTSPDQTMKKMQDEMLAQPLEDTPVRIDADRLRIIPDADADAPKAAMPLAAEGQKEKDAELAEAAAVPATGELRKAAATDAAAPLAPAHDKAKEEEIADNEADKTKFDQDEEKRIKAMAPETGRVFGDARQQAAERSRLSDAQTAANVLNLTEEIAPKADEAIKGEDREIIRGAMARDGGNAQEGRQESEKRETTAPSAPLTEVGKGSAREAIPAPSRAMAADKSGAKQSAQTLAKASSLEAPAAESAGEDEEKQQSEGEKKLAADADKAFREGQWAQALALYDALLAQKPKAEDEANFLAAKAVCQAQLRMPNAETLKRLEALSPERAAEIRRAIAKIVKDEETRPMAPAAKTKTPAGVRIKRWHPTADDYER